MHSFLELRQDLGFQKLINVSAKLGRDPLQVQGPGGNTSIKRDGAMWIKASGTWLAEATERDIFVPVHAKAFAEAVRTRKPGAGNTRDFAAKVENAPPHHASIETCVHAVLDWPVVLHTHCVETIAVAVRENAEMLTSAALSDLEAVFIPYIKPGLDLAHSILERTNPKTRVLVLGNHGLVATGNTVDEAETLLLEVSRRLSKLNDHEIQPAHCTIAPDALGSDWMASPSLRTQAVAFTEHLIEKLQANTLYPDHLIFLGPGCAIAEPGESVHQAAERASAGDASRKLVLVPGHGVAIPKDSTPATLALANGFGEIITRIPKDAELTYLTKTQEDELINWDAEKLRQELNKKAETA